MKEELSSAIEDVLFSLNISTETESDRITWKDNFGAENWIIYADQHLDNLAWWKSNDVGKDLLMFTKDNFTISWTPPIKNMGMSFGCMYLKFYHDKIIVAYPDKHVERVFVVNTSNLKAEEIFFAHSLGIAVEGSMIFIKDFEKNEYLSVNLENSNKKIEMSEDDFKSHSVTLKKRWGSEKF